LDEMSECTSRFTFTFCPLTVFANVLIKMNSLEAQIYNISFEVAVPQKGYY
jgi:hypothetical protein